MADVTLYKTRDQTLVEMLAQLQGMVPDAYVGDDGIIRIMFEIEAAQFENVFLANQLVLQDMFIQTASLEGLIQHGVQINLPLKDGTFAAGTITLEGSGGTYIPISSEVGYDPGGGVDLSYFLTTLDGTIPNPGVPSAPTVALGGAGVLTGTYEYRVTFTTASGETLSSADSAAISPSSQQVNLSAIPVGGAGTVARNIYRDKNGAGTYRLVGTIANNTGTTFTDNVADATVAGNSLAPTVDTAHRITLPAQAEVTGADGNVIANTITELTNVPPSITGIVASSVFAGGTDIEDTEVYRQRLLDYVRNPQTGSPADLKTWAESVSGVDTATVFTNDNLGVATNGHATIRIAGPDGIVPDAGVQAAVLAYLLSKDLANITLHVATFTQLTLNVTVDVTTVAGLVVSDVSVAVQNAVSDYINSLAVGETFYQSGVIAAVKSLAGIADVVVTSPGNTASTPTQKFVPGTVTVV